MSGLVVDCSITIAWLMPDEGSVAAQRLLDRVGRSGAVVPGIWHLEVGNVLLMSERRGRISAIERGKALRYLAALPIAVDGETAAKAWSAAAALADRHRLTLCDAAYLELAERLALPLASLDSELRAAAQAEGLTVLGA